MRRFKFRTEIVRKIREVHYGVLEQQLVPRFDRFARFAVFVLLGTR